MNDEEIKQLLIKLHQEGRPPPMCDCPSCTAARHGENVPVWPVDVSVPLRELPTYDN